MYILAPSPELWTRVLKHRTQILYLPDISLVCAYLELRPGCVVLESGTGSGSMSHSLARAVHPSGHLYTFEYHEERSKIAGEEFKNNGNCQWHSFIPQITSCAQSSSTEIWHMIPF